MISVSIKNDKYFLRINSIENRYIHLEVWQDFDSFGCHSICLEEHRAWLPKSQSPEDWLRGLTCLWKPPLLEASYPRLFENLISLERVSIDDKSRYFHFDVYGFTWQQIAEAVKKELGMQDVPVFTADDGKKYKFIDGKMEEVE